VDFVYNDRGYIGVSHDAEAFEDEPRKRIKHPRRRVDWSILLREIKDRTGLSNKELALLLGMTRHKLEAIVRGDLEWAEADKAVSAIIYYVLNIGRDSLPMIGEYRKGDDPENEIH